MGILVSIIFMIYALIDYKKAVILVAMIIQTQPHLGTGIPGLRIFPLLVVYLVFLFFVKERRKRHFNIQPPYPKSLVLVSVVFSLCMLFTEYYTHNGNYALVIVNCITYFILPYLLYKCLDGEKKLKYLLKVCIVFYTLAVIVAVSDQLLHHNYFYDMMESLFSFDMFSVDSTEIRYGIKRSSSIFAQGGHAGLFCMYAFLIFFYNKYYFNSTYKKRITNYMICFLPLVAFLSGSRAIYLGLAFVFMSLPIRQFFKRKSTYIIIVILILGGLCSLSYFSDIIDSMINSDKGGGSTAEMRQWQWDICMKYFDQSPWWGNGRMYIWNVVKPANPLLLGAESIWFSLIVDNGIIGCVNFVLLTTVSSLTLMVKTNKSLFFMPLAYFAIMCFSTQLGMEYNVLLTFIVIMIRLFDYKGIHSRIIQ